MGVSSSSSVNNIYNKLGIKNTGIGGLASGLDTESLVEALTAGTRAKIARQGQLKTVLKWEQSAYRSVTNALTKFQEKHIYYNGFGSDTGSNNINSPDFFNVFKGSSTSAIANFNASQSTASGTVKVGSVDQLATNQTIKAGLNTQTLIGDVIGLSTQTFVGKTLEINVGGSTKSIDLSPLDSHKTNTATFQTQLQNLLDTAVGSSNVTVTVGGSPGFETIELKANNSAQITLTKDCDELGFKKGQTNKVSALNTPLVGGDTNFTAQSYSNQKLTLKVGNNTRVIDLSSLESLKSATPPTAFAAELQNLITAAVGTLADGTTPLVEVNIEDGSALGTYTVELIGNGSTQVTVVEACTELGLAEGDANFIDPLTKPLKELFNLSGDTFVFKINDIEFTFSDTDTLGALCNKITTSKANVSLTWDEHNQQLVFTSKVAGSGENIRIEDVSGRLMNTIVGARGSNNLSSIGDINQGFESSYSSSGPFNAEAIFAVNAGLNPPKNLVFQISINGVSQTISIEIPDISIAGTPNKYGSGNKTAEEYLAEALNNELITQFGADVVKDKIYFEVESTGEFTIKSPLNTKIEFESVGTIGPNDIHLVEPAPGSGFFNHTETNENLALAELNKIPGLATSGSFQLSVNGVSAIISWVDTDSVQDIITAINTAFFPDTIASFEDGRLIIDAGDDNSLSFTEDPVPIPPPALSGNFLDAFFGLSSYDGEPDPAVCATEYGLNAQITLEDGTIISQNSNTFNIGGIAFDVLNVGAGFTITSEADTDELIDKIKTFVEEYNAMVESLNSLIYEKPVSGYDALTDEQKAEMTEAQIKDWENEAKKGLLYNDATIRSLITDMRTAMTKTVEEAGLSLYDIGIQPKSYLGMTNSSGGYNLGKAGTFEVNEERLRAALENNIDGVRTLFTHKPYANSANPDDYGIAQELNLAINKYTAYSTVRESQGRLVALAGSDNGYSSADTSEIANKISRIDTYVATLKMRLEQEYRRHWSKFTALETALSRMSAQSGWLADFGS